MAESAGLLDRGRFATTDFDVAHEWIRAAYMDHRMLAKRPTGSFRYVHDHCSALGFTVAEVTHAASIDVIADPSGDLLIQHVRVGRFRSESEGEELTPVDGDVFLSAAPDAEHHIAWNEQTRLELVRLDLAVVARFAREAGAADHLRLRFTSRRPISLAHQLRYQHVIDFVTNDLFSNPHVSSSPILVATAQKLLAAAVLNTFPNTAGGAVAHAETGSAALARRSVEYIDGHAALGIDLTDIANGAGGTPQAVVAAFRRHLGIAPAAYVQRVRLQCAHRQLQNADPEGADTVESVAAAWGFASASDFADAYEHTFLWHPSRTLRD